MQTNNSSLTRLTSNRVFRAAMVISLWLVVPVWNTGSSKGNSGLATASASAANASVGDGEIVSVIFYQKDGTQVAYAMDDHPRFTFRGNNRFVIFQTDRETVVYQVSKLDKFVFSDDPTAIRSSAAAIENATQNIKREAGTLAFAGFQKDTPIRVCDIAGKTVLSSRTDAQGTATLSLSALGSGIYIITAGDATLKIKK